MPADELVRHAAQGVDVGPRTVVAPLAAQLLGGHVSRRAGGQVERGIIGVASRFDGGMRDAEVAEQYARAGVAVDGEQHVAGLQIAMDDAEGVRGRERVEHL